MAGESIQKLRDLYEKNRHFLDEQESKIAHPVIEGNYFYNVLLRNDLSSKMKKVFSDFELQTLNILNDFPEKKYKEEFLKTTKPKEKSPFFFYPVEFRDLIIEQATFSAKLDTLLEIIKKLEKEDSENHRANEIAYSLTYNDISGRLYLNDLIIHECKATSFLGETLEKAIINPGEKIEIKNKNLASAVSTFKMPEELRKIMFRTGRGIFKLKTAITYRELEKNNLSKKELDNALQKLQED